MKSLLVVALVGLLAGQCWGGESKLPDLAELKVAAEKGDAKAQYELGKKYRSRGDNANAEKWFRLAGAQGNGDAENAVGDLLMIQVSQEVNGKTVYRKPDYAQAVSWYSKAANDGCRAAFSNLAQCYKEGKGVKQNLVEAYKYYAVADKLGDIFAKHHRDALILKMSSAEVQQAQNAADVILNSLPKK